LRVEGGVEEVKIGSTKNFFQVIRRMGKNSGTA
jgi:hypothetical protein